MKNAPKAASRCAMLNSGGVDGPLLKRENVMFKKDKKGLNGFSMTEGAGFVS